MRSALGNYTVNNSKAQKYRGFAYVKRGKYYTVRKIMDEMPSLKHKMAFTEMGGTLYTSVNRIKSAIDNWYIDIEKN